MVIFIDESGTHTKIGHATTAIVYVSISNLEKVEQKILKIEKEIKIQTFHWGEERWQVRNKFLAKVLELDFVVKVAIFENPVHPERMEENPKKWFKKLDKEKKIAGQFLFDAEAVEKLLAKTHKKPHRKDGVS